MKPHLKIQIKRPVMEFTETEKRLLKISHALKQQRQIFLLIAGIFFIIAGIGVWTYSYFGIIPAGETSFKQMEAQISGVQVHSEGEAFLKKMLLVSTKKLARDKKTVAQNKFIQAGFFLLFCGLIFFVVYWKDRTYHSLIRKLRDARVSEE
jgi:hypothetical protein